MRLPHRPIGLLPFLVAMLAAASPAAAQSADGARWSLFAGRSIVSDAGAPVPGVSENFGVGGSVDFRSSLLPVPLRASLAYDQFHTGFTTFRVTAVHLDGIFRPVPHVLGIRPYLVGGFGVAVQAPTGSVEMGNDNFVFVPVSRHAALQLRTGLGLEFRRFFVEYRRSPFTIAGSGVAAYAPVSLGLRF